MHVLLFAPGPDTAGRVPVLACADALKKGAEVQIVPLDSDQEVDAALESADRGARIVVAGGDGQLRAVLRRMVRRVQPRGGDRTGLARDRTIPDLPAVGVLPLDARDDTDLAARLRLPRTPKQVAAAVLGGAVRRIDLLRNDGGSVTLHGALIGAADDTGRPLGWLARIDVDDKLLTDGSEPLIACAIANADGYTNLAELPLILRADPADGALDVGIALPGPDGVVEVRRARGRAVSVALVSAEVPFTDDGVDGTLTRKRTWWMERSAWGVYGTE